jgi:hypothetical protein
MEVYLNVREFSENAAPRCIVHREHHGSESKLEVDRGRQMEIFDHFQDASGFAEVAAHWLLKQNN